MLHPALNSGTSDSVPFRRHSHSYCHFRTSRLNLIGSFDFWESSELTKVNMDLWRHTRTVGEQAWTTNYEDRPRKAVGSDAFGIRALHRDLLPHTNDGDLLSAMTAFRNIQPY